MAHPLGHLPPPILWPRPSLAIHVYTATAHDTAFTRRRHRCKRISSEFGWGPARITTDPARSKYEARYYIIISITVAALERARTSSTARITRSHAALTGQQMYVFGSLLCPAVTSLTRTFQFLASRRFHTPGFPSDRSSSLNRNEPRLRAPAYGDSDTSGTLSRNNPSRWLSDRLRNVQVARPHLNRTSFDSKVARRSVDRCTGISRGHQGAYASCDVL